MSGGVGGSRRAIVVTRPDRRAGNPSGAVIGRFLRGNFPKSQPISQSVKSVVNPLLLPGGDCGFHLVVVLLLR